MDQNGEILSSRIKWLITLRTVVISFILALAVIMQLKGMKTLLTPQLIGLYTVAGLSYLLTLIYAAFYQKVHRHTLYGYIQLTIDNLLITLIIMITGGVDSLYSVLYFLTIIGASIIYYRKGGLLITSLGSVFYLISIFTPFFYHRVSPWLDIESRYHSLTFSYVFYRGMINILAFYLICLLSSYLSESLRRTGEALIARESDLAELQSLYENIVQSISSGLITTDLKGRIVAFNKAAEKITGRQSAKCRGEEFLTIFRLPRGSSPFHYAWGDRESGWRCEGGLVDTPSTVLGMTFSPLRDEHGKVNGVICSFQDLTDIKKLEEQIKQSDKLAAIGEMAAGVAHEIRNPLASISGSIQVLKEDVPANDNARSLMDIVTRETDRLNNIITDFLLFANPRPLQLTKTEIGPLVNDTLSLLEKSLPRERDYRFFVSDESGGRSVYIDCQLIRQVFWNLALNAIQAMPEGGDIEIRIAFQEGNRLPGKNQIKEYLIIKFIDTGIGIASEEMGKVFTPFFSIKENGTGLGLSIVFKIIEKHRGSIEFESKKGKGSVFTIKLPVEGVHDE